MNKYVLQCRENKTQAPAEVHRGPKGNLNDDYEYEVHK